MGVIIQPTGASGRQVAVPAPSLAAARAQGEPAGRDHRGNRRPLEERPADVQALPSRSYPSCLGCELTCKTPSGPSSAATERLAEIKVELDRCYDLLHQRQARRAAGLDPDEAALRPVEVVERYQQ